MNTPSLKWKIIHYTENQEDFKLNEKRQIKDSNIEMTKTLEQSDQNTASMINMFQWAITNMPEINEKVERLHKEKENFDNKT